MYRLCARRSRPFCIIQSGWSERGFCKISPLSFETFCHKDLLIEKVGVEKARKKRPVEEVKFGEDFSDHMLEVEWNSRSGWGRPKISPVHNLSLHPAAKVLHYSVEAFEGLKAYKGVDDKIRLFRPELNANRLLKSVERSCLPKFNREEFLNCLCELVRIDRDWVPNTLSSSLYIRPTIISTDPTIGIDVPKQCLLYIIACPVGSYWGAGQAGLKAVSLYANTTAVRAWPGGAGRYKIGSNYGPTIYHLQIAQQHGCSQNLWLYGEEQKVTEVGAMNFFVYWINEHGEKELITSPLDDLILPGVTRQCIIELSRQWGKFKVTEKHYTMNQLMIALQENRVLEVFGSGTAAVICPVEKILYDHDGKLNELRIPTMKNLDLTTKLYKTICDIQIGAIPYAGWSKVVD